MLTDQGIWLSTETPPRREGRPGLFLDRDGVLIREVNYLKSKEDVALEAGAAGIIRWARARDFGVAAITNQSGIARGIVSWADFEAVEAEIARQLAAAGVALDLVVACPFHPDFTPGYGAAEDVWRKPGPRMIEEAALRMDLDLAASWLIGDKASDIEAAKRAGLKGAVTVATGYGAQEREAAMALRDNTFEVIAADRLTDAQAVLNEAF
ncbi:HAD-IIIA family hydrolase [Parvibaculum sp.]|uniref:D-glycero-alpha-D-manno-heptose-1,7-bisphosphate 7-phosphatase n=1 Tax=Parvibaculum sp. TaxID=2024848 RepID=UPI001D9127E0|nr:HAD-IIIA family hydrolase [Parvibaculum sp.]MBX3489236.1 HAD-IIIA family hydrolase [Parvibaculum sp.]MCW5726903.1 HAD-IIIA family hydrolase [Parvibaculum sp.]